MLETATGGNPLFVGAVLDAVAREGTSPTARHAPRLLEIGAHGVSRAVGLRLARLRPEALALLRAASILGDGAELRHAAALAGVDANALGAATAVLVRLDLLRREDPLEFVHPAGPKQQFSGTCWPAAHSRSNFQTGRELAHLDPQRTAAST